MIIFLGVGVARGAGLCRCGVAVNLALRRTCTTRAQGSVGGDSKVSDAKSSKNWEKVKQAVKEKQHLPADVLHESDETHE